MDLQKEEDGIPERKKQLHIDRGNFLVSFADCNISHFKGLTWTMRNSIFRGEQQWEQQWSFMKFLYWSCPFSWPGHCMKTLPVVFQHTAWSPPQAQLSPVSRCNKDSRLATGYPNSWMVLYIYIIYIMEKSNFSKHWGYDSVSYPISRHNWTKSQLPGLTGP